MVLTRNTKIDLAHQRHPHRLARLQVPRVTLENSLVMALVMTIPRIMILARGLGAVAFRGGCCLIWVECLDSNVHFTVYI